VTIWSHVKREIGRHRVPVLGRASRVDRGGGGSVGDLEHVYVLQVLPNGRCADGERAVNLCIRLVARGSREHGALARRSGAQDASQTNLTFSSVGGAEDICALIA
jgi:hypothetical protein